MKERIHLKKMGSFFMSFFAGTDDVHVACYNGHKREEREALIWEKQMKHSMEI